MEIQDVADSRKLRLTKCGEKSGSVARGVSFFPQAELIFSNLPLIINGVCLSSALPTPYSGSPKKCQSFRKEKASACVSERLLPR